MRAEFRIASQVRHTACLPFHSPAFSDLQSASSGLRAVSMLLNRLPYNAQVEPAIRNDALIDYLIDRDVD